MDPSAFDVTTLSSSLIMKNEKVGIMLGVQNASHFITDDDVDLGTCFCLTLTFFFYQSFTKIKIRLERADGAWCNKNSISTQDHYHDHIHHM